MRSIVQSRAVSDALRVFISYSHKDEEYKDELLKHLAIFKRSNLIESWHDRLIEPGTEWKNQINHHLNSANVILLLISENFVYSDYCWDIEMGSALERHANGEATVIPIILKPIVDWEHSPFASLQVLPEDGYRYPIINWEEKSNAFYNVAKGIQKILKERESQVFPKENKTLSCRVEWTLRIQGDTEHFSKDFIDSLTVALRKVARDVSISIMRKRAGSVQLDYQSTLAGYKNLSKYQDEQSLGHRLGLIDVELSEAIGAIVHITAQDVDPCVFLSESYLSHITAEPNGPKQSHPLLTSITIPFDNPKNIGLGLSTDASIEIAKGRYKQMLQNRLGRYFNTFLIVKEENLHADLSPLKGNFGLPEILKPTELGRDMLAQDFVLKCYTAGLLDPRTETGNIFWTRLEGGHKRSKPFKSCFRVWVVPGDATVEEKPLEEKNAGYVELKNFSLKVLSEIDYLAEKSIGSKGNYADGSEGSDYALAIFKELILPKVSDEVNKGPNFALLRQIYSVSIMAAWIKRKFMTQFGELPKFFDSNDLKPLHLDVVNENETARIQKEYIRIFSEGIWRCVRSGYSEKEGRNIRRLYIGGSVFLTPSIH